MRCRLLSAKKTLFDGESEMVVAHSPQGEFAILPNHAPFLATLDSAPLRIKTNEGFHTFAVLTGVLRVSKEGVTIVSPEVICAQEIDLAAVKARKETVEKKLAETEDKTALLHELAALQAQERAKKHNV
jgi:F-type H+-transporting ATPase subunit epsilon